MLAGVGQDAIARSLTSARVDLNPHQIEAALFALQSPLAKGVILADEVGLGKTIEASLVIAQRWAERRRKVLLIVPASLRKQWQQELADKFSLPSFIMEAKAHRDLRKTGKSRPFERTGEIVIVSYEFAARRADELAAISWDLVIFDEAHRLRNVFKKAGSQRAKDLQAALAHHFKILLTATPLQNSLMELYGLVSMIDGRFFGDQDAFRTLYLANGRDRLALVNLRERLKPIYKRHLRKDVQAAGHISYTARRAKTFTFEPRDLEAQLYDGVSGFLQRTDTIAFGSRTNQLLIMQARKILGSSVSAIAGFLDGVIARVESRNPVDQEAFEDLEDVQSAFDDNEEENETDADDATTPTIDPEVWAAEMKELKNLRALCEQIGPNAKGEKLVAGLPEVLKEVVARGGQRKAVIFTESVRTQRYLNEILSKNGYAGQIVLLNGSNADPESQIVYRIWRAKHEGTEALSGSKTADMKAAVVDAFKGPDKTIMIATESGAEGINLQFCSLVINFDLPWNPQRVEQRIGRCHRYGQKIDVTVVNMLNLKNEAERRIYELLDTKFKLFEGVFGASDDVLGTIASGLDFERQLVTIVQECRSADAVAAAFRELGERLQDQIDADLSEARAKLFNVMDEGVIAKLQQRGKAIVEVIGDFEKRMIAMAKAELPDAAFIDGDRQSFQHNGEVWTTRWPQAEENGWRFFRLTEGTLADQVAQRAHSRDLRAERIEITFEARAYPFDGQLADVVGLIGQSGWLRVSQGRIDTLGQMREDLLMACVADDGRVVARETVDRMMLTPGVLKANNIEVPSSALIACDAKETEAFGARLYAENARWLEEEETRLRDYARDLELEIDARVAEIDDQLELIRKERRSPDRSLEEKIALGRKLSRLEEDRDELISSKTERKRAIRREIDTKLDEIAESLNQKPEITPLFTVRWSVV
jgi:ERCC4-related helicase